MSTGLFTKTNLQSTTLTFTDAPAPTGTGKTLTINIGEPSSRVPKYTLPAGWAYQNGGFVRTEAPWNKLPGESGVILDPSAYTTAVTLVDSGTRTTNWTNLQNAINAAYARAGHTIIYLDGGEWASSNGEITVPAPSGSNDGTYWCVIADKRLDPNKGVAFPRASGKRVQSGDETGMPSFSIVYAPNTGGTTDTVTGVTTGGRPYSAFYLPFRVRRFAVVGCHFQYDASYDPGAHDVTSYTGLNEGFLHSKISDVTPSSAADYPDYIGVDRCVAHGILGKAMTRAFYMGGHYIFYTNCNIDNAGAKVTDSQCILTSTGAGPYLIQNNYLGCGWGENFIAGGGNCWFDTEVPSDIVFVGNYSDFPPAMKNYGGVGATSNYDHKNLFELKAGRRVLVTGNQFAHYIGTGNYGSQWFALNIKAVSQGQLDKTGSAWWDLTYDVTIWGNQFIDCNALLQICDASQNYGTPDFHRVEVANNVSLAVDATAYNNLRGWTLQIGGYDAGISDWQTNETARPRNIHIHHNTIWIPTFAAGLGFNSFVFGADSINSGPMAPLTHYTVRDNIAVFQGAASGPYWGCGNASHGNDSSAQNYNDYAKLGTIWGVNAIIGSPGTQAGAAGDPGNVDVLYTDTTSAGVNSDGTLTSGSPLQTLAADGGPMGADIAYVNAATAGATTGL